jgi:DNA excision repair protein ERCC-2
MKSLNLAVTDFAQKNVITGDIDERTGVSQVPPELGLEIHREIQDRRSNEFKDYRREVKLKEEVLNSSNVAIHICGRIDGTWTDDNEFVIEEIKSTFNIQRLVSLLHTDSDHSYILQLKTYGWLVWKRQGITPKLQLLLVSAGSRAERVFPISFDPIEFSKWVEQRSIFLRDLWLQVLEFKTQRKLLAKSLKFPFPKKRRGQLELITDVTNACKNKTHFLAQAPTGLGKTASVIFPMLKFVLRRGDKLFYVTPKNSQLTEAEKFLKFITTAETGPLGLIMTAKPKICMQTDVVCTPEACPFAKRHYDKVNENQLLQRLRRETIINADTLRNYAHRYEVCPYELSRQVLPWVDVVAGDYHYALSPHANLRDVAKLPLVPEPRPLLAIDEAHNLAERAIEWYSHDITFICDTALDYAPKKIKKSMSGLNKWLQNTLTGTVDHPIIKELNREELVDRVNNWTRDMPLVLENDTDNRDQQALVNEWFSWLTMADFCQLPKDLFFATRDPSAQILSVHCANAGPLMREQLSKFETVVAFSATLKPFSFHQEMNGFDPLRVISKEYQSPFPSSNRRIIAIPQVSTAWRDRPRNIPKIVDVIERIIALKRGNYIAFFPSFELLRQALPLVKAEGFDVIEQPSAASVEWVQDVLRNLREKQGVLVMAVQGGVLSEGIDLPGEQLIGAFIIGPALPAITPEREERRRLLGSNSRHSFARVYGYPAIARSIQSAGRVIRSAKDRGIIIMMDPRFLKEPYLDALPSDWLGENRSGEPLLSHAILTDLRAFWDDSASSLEIKESL